MTEVLSPTARLDPLAFALTELDAGRPVATATVMSTFGSGPVPVGGQMAIAADGRFAGSVSGGCVEDEVIGAAARAIATGRTAALSFGIADQAAWRVGLPCGGKIEILVEPHSPQSRPLFEMLATAAQAREIAVVETVIASGACRTIRDIEKAALPAAILAKAAAGESCISGEGEARTFYRVVAPRVRLVIVGATHIAQILSELSLRAGYAVIVIDPRDAYAATPRFAPGVTLIDEWPAEGLATMTLDRFTAVVALAHVAHLDDAALMAAFRHPNCYIGALGSRLSHAKRLERLRHDGAGEVDLARIHAPVGLPIGALTPEEIAVAILAEIIGYMRAKDRTA